MKDRIARNGAVTRGAFCPWFMTNQACTYVLTTRLQQHGPSSSMSSSAAESRGKFDRRGQSAFGGKSQERIETARPVEKRALRTRALLQG